MRKQSLILLISMAFCLPAFCQTSATDTTGAEYQQVDSAMPVKKGEPTRKEKDMMARSLTPTEGRALIYILRPSGFGALIKMSVLCDSVHIGATKAGNFVYAMVTPGRHILESHAENNASMDITVEAGKTYYVRQQVKMGFAYAETGLKMLDDTDGQKDLKKCKLAKDNVATQ